MDYKQWIFVGVVIGSSVVGPIAQVMSIEDRAKADDINEKEKPVLIVEPFVSGTVSSIASRLT